MTTEKTTQERHERHERHEKPVAETASTRPAIAPAVDIYENEQQYLVLADLPGVANDGVEIRFEKGELSLFARRPDEAGADYRRLFTIPETVDSERIDAALQAGVLHLTLPKASKAKPRQISVKAS